MKIAGKAGLHGQAATKGQSKTAAVGCRFAFGMVSTLLSNSARHLAHDAA
jgi:hypothetical protein